MTHESFQKLLADLRASGLSKKRYCANRGVNYSTFQYWLRKIRNTPPLGDSGFVRISTLPVSEAIEVRLPGGIAIAVRPGFDAVLLRDIVRTLAS